MQTQFNNLAALLTLGLSKKNIPDADLSKADWGVLVPFIFTNHLVPIARSAFGQLAEKKLPTPPAEVANKIIYEAVQGLVKHPKRMHDIIEFTTKWVKEDKRPLAIGGYVFSRFYPNRSLRNEDTLVCVPLRRNAPDDVEVGATNEQNLEFRTLRVVVPDSATGPFSMKGGEGADAVLRTVFFSEPCVLDQANGLAYPNPEFLALYHLYSAQQLLLHSRVPFIMVVDWAMLLNALMLRAQEKFNWAGFREHVTDLGLLRFTQRFTALAQRLTGIELSAELSWLTDDVSDKDVAYLYECIITGVEADTTSVEEKGRFSRFADVLRNSKKYSRFSDVSPAKQAFRYLFS